MTFWNSAFSLESFGAALRSAFSEDEGASLAARHELVVDGLDDAPEPALAWVYGLYATLLGRLPDAEGKALYLARIRRGDPVGGIVDEFLLSPEGIRMRAEAPAGLGPIYAAGCSLTVLGHLPSSDWLDTYVTLFDETADPELVLEQAKRSPEARAKLLYPPELPSFEQAVAECVQLVVYGRSPEQAATASLLEDMQREPSLARLIRKRLQAEPARSARLRAVLRSRRLAQEVRMLAGSRQVHNDLAVEREWQWRTTLQGRRKDAERASSVVAAVVEARAAAAEIDGHWDGSHA